MGARNHSSFIALRFGVAIALVLGGSATLAEGPPTGSGTVRLVCEPAAETEVHAHGDPHWIGHEMKQLQEVLGKEDMCLGKPSKNMVLVYNRRDADCLDAYVIDACNMVINYYCRPVPAAPMKWNRQTAPRESE